MRRVMDLARALAQGDSPVLILGESGRGKRLARFVHEHSARADGPFIAVHCAAISESLLESELFGHSRDAVTGANAGRPGLLRPRAEDYLSRRGGRIPLPLQVKLLSALEDQEVQRLGERRNRPSTCGSSPRPTRSFYRRRRRSASVRISATA